MKEFIEKLIGRLEEQQAEAENEMHRLRSGDYTLPCSYDITDIKEIASESFKESIQIVNELAEEYNNANDSMEIQIAKNYAKCLVEYGVDIRDKWETATSQSMALNQAYMRGRQDERDIFDEWQEKHINTSTDTSSGWIPCSRELPPQPKENALFEYKPLEVYLVSLSSTDYPWRAFWNGKYFTDGFSKVEPIAWMPLPAPYKEGCE